MHIFPNSILIPLDASNIQLRGRIDDDEEEEDDGDVRCGELLLPSSSLLSFKTPWFFSGIFPNRDAMKEEEDEEDSLHF